MDMSASPMRADAHRLGGALVLLGAVAWIVLSGLHGALPGTGSHDLEHAAQPLWRPIHVLTIVAIAMVAAGLAMLGGLLGAPRAAALGRAGGAFVVPAGAVIGVGYAIDGYVFANLAERAATGDQALREMVRAQADLLVQVIAATSFAFQASFGLGVALLGLATLLSAEYPRALCVLGAVGGAVWLLGGVLLFSRAPGIGDEVLIAAGVAIAVWLLGIGWLAWRRGAPPLQAR
jgi:hypothetical protein